MPNKKPIMMNPGHDDDLQTPEWALDPIIPYLDKKTVIWECAAGNGNLVRGLEKAGFLVTGTDIHTGTDFFSNHYPLGTGTILTNPPYSEKDKWIGRCYMLGLPFALLLPITALGGRFRQAMYRENGLQVLFFDRRVNFEVPSGKNDPWFATAWFTWQLKLPKDMMFVEIEKTPE